jgi:hypothetical protein
MHDPLFKQGPDEHGSGGAKKKIFKRKLKMKNLSDDFSF